MVYLDHEQIESARKAYNLQLRELENNVDELYQICHKLYLRDRDQKGSEDWETLSHGYLSKLANSKYLMMTKMTMKVGIIVLHFYFCTNTFYGI